MTTTRTATTRTATTHAATHPAPARTASDAPRASTAETRVPALDRLASGGHVLSRLGPLQLPPRAALVDALRRIAAVGPDARIGLQSTRPGHRRHSPDDLDALAERMVVVDETGDLGRLDRGPALAALAARIEPGLPVLFVVSGDHLLAIYDHGVVDSRFTAQLPGAVLELAAGGAMPDWVTATGARHPLLSALRATFVRHPRRVVDLLRSRGGAGPVAATARDRVVPGLVSPATSADHDVRTAGVPVVVAVQGTADSYRELRRWLRAAQPAPSFAAATLVAIRQALLDEGVDLDPLADVVYDVRQYLDGDDQVTGNFITALPLAGGLDPVAVDGVLKATVSAGRPLAALALGALRETIRPGRPSAGRPVAATPDGGTRARVSFSSVGVIRPIQRLPWLRDGRVAEASYAVHPVGPGTISIQLLIVDGAVQMAVALGAGVPAATVERAFGRVVLEPVTLLEAAARSTRPAPPGPTS